MRKFLSALVLMGIAVVLFYACKKDSNNMQTETTIEQHTDYEWQVYYKLKAYKQKQNSNFKTSNQVSLDSAEWYMETQLNVEEAHTEEPFKPFRLDTTYYDIAISEDELVNFSDMNAMYNEMLSDLDSLEILIADPYAFPYIGELSLMSTGSSEANFRLILGFGNTYNGNYISIETDDNWRWGDMKGHCDGTNFGESDAGQELINRLNNPLFAWATPGSYIDPIQEHILYDEYPDVNNQNPDPNVNYMVYFEETNSSNWPCIEYNELQFYLDRLHEIIYTYSTENIPNTTTLYGKRPEGKAYVPGMTTIYTPSGGSGSAYWWEHKLWMKYATRVNIPIPD